MTRSATDLLLEIEKKQEEILLYLKNQDLLLKTIVNKLNNTETKVVEMESNFIPPEVITEKQIPGLKPGVVLKKNTTDVVQVQQKVLFRDGKAVSSAKIEIFVKQPGSNELVFLENRKTNEAGKWTSSLPPGNYVVKAFKKGTTRDKTVEVKDEITVPNSDVPVQLRPLQQ